jgi:hypothetical protein
MAKNQNKTIETEESVFDFLNRVTDESKRKDCFEIVEIMKEQSGFDPKMWGPAIVGFGTYHYTYESGREGDAPLVAFSPRKAEISLYLASGFDQREALLKEFGKHKSSKACIYIKRIADIDVQVLRKMVSLSVEHVKNLYQ